MADLSSQSAVRGLASEILERYPQVHVLANNAGGIFGRPQVSVDGIELTWALNHLAPFLLTTLLLDRLKASAPARVITTSSVAHAGTRLPDGDPTADLSGYGTAGFGRYGQTKLANILFTAELARRLEGTGVTANCFHPGYVASDFNMNNGLLWRAFMTMGKPFARSAKKGADTLVWLADAEDVAGQSGYYFMDRSRVTPSQQARDADEARRLWELSEEQTRISERK
jgi:NAD(P)-dependent dehydrogenase (short-subunit alcohol dehydrogenase family)